MIRHCLSLPETKSAGRFLPVFKEFSIGLRTFVKRIWPNARCAWVGVCGGCTRGAISSECCSRSGIGTAHSNTFQFPDASRSAVMRTSLPTRTPSGTSSIGKDPRGCRASAACHVRLPSGRVPEMTHGRSRMRYYLNDARWVTECDRQRQIAGHSSFDNARAKV